MENFLILCVFYMILSKFASNSLFLKENDNMMSEFANIEMKNYLNEIRNSRDLNYEVIGVPKNILNRRTDVIHWNFTAFGEVINLNLTKRIRILNENPVIYKMNNHVKNNNEKCHYININETVIVSFDNCVRNEIVSLHCNIKMTIFKNILPFSLQNAHFQFHKHDMQIYPLNKKLQLIIKKEKNFQKKYKNMQPHIIVSSNFTSNIPFENLNSKFTNESSFTEERHSTKKNPLLKIAIFLDNLAYEKFTNATVTTTTSIESLIGLYMNGVQSIYNHSSLKSQIDIAVTGIYRITKNFDTSLAENSDYPIVINHFCSEIAKYVKSGFSKDWDISVLLSGMKVIDLTSTNILGHASGNICTEKACVVVRIGGMNLAHALSHEIGHM